MGGDATPRHQVRAGVASMSGASARRRSVACPTMAHQPAGVSRSIDTCDLCVVGAGMAGLAAAHEAASSGARVIVLEATQRPGGRARTVRPRWAGGAAVECGPEFVD